MDKVKMFRETAESLGNLYEKKTACYGDSFGETFRKLGLISAVTRISDKYNRLVSLATNNDIDDLGESIEDTLKDLANYSIMTLMELRLKLSDDADKIVASVNTNKFTTKEGRTYICECTLQNNLYQGSRYKCHKDGFITDKNNVMLELSKYPSIDWEKYLREVVC